MSSDTPPPPAGGLGSAGQAGPRFEATGEPRRSRGALTVGLVVLGLVLTFVGMWFAIQRQIRHSKTAEARTQLANIARGAVLAFERDHRVCPSASRPVPEKLWAACVPDDGRYRGDAFYQSVHQDWLVDAERNAGFACLGFEMIAPQYNQYVYEATADGFTARTIACFPDIGAFEVRGRVVDGKMTVGKIVAIPRP